MWKVIVSLNFYLLVKLVFGDLDAAFHHCCSLGQNKTLDPLKCESKIRTPIVEVAVEEQSLCLSTADLCCIQTLRDNSCKTGKQAAKSGRSCTTNFKTEEDSSFRYCCEACKVGIIAGSMAMCNLKAFKFESPWDQVYRTCCEESLISNFTPTDLTTSITSESPNICNLITDKLCDHICVPVNGSYRCQCRPGFTLLADSKSCYKEVGNRCERNNPCEHECYDNGTSIECSCKEGFILLADRTSCEDIDECKDGSQKCNLQTQTCINHAGGYRCEPKSVKPVPVGFTVDRITGELVDINECATVPCQENEFCINTLGSFKCECTNGFLWNAVTASCVDIDECTSGLHNCNSLSNCINSVGSFQCVPKTSPTISVPKFVPQNIPGFTYDPKTGTTVDIDECRSTSNLCGSYEECVNSIGSYTCACKEGYERDRVTDACIDINECQTKRHGCNPQFHRCDNTIGSYHCVRVVSCGTGYTFNSQSGICEDDDECALGTHNCRTLGPNYECINSAGTFKCVKKQCTDTTTCGHFSTATCPVGYVLADGKCKDINECARGNVCQQGHNCQNTPGSFRCVPNVGINCSAGTRLDENSNRCIDIDECAGQPNICSHKCINTYGSFICTCKQGFYLHEDKRSCIDVNECELSKHRRFCAYTCINEPGSYRCSCPDGYRLGADGASCIDIDECSSQNKCRNPQEICMNMRGNYRCNTITCPENYVQDAVRKNRCIRAPTFCQFNDEPCSKEPLSYSFNYITFVSNVPIPSSGPIPLFNMQGTTSGISTISFKLELKTAKAPRGIPKVTPDYFYLNQTSFNSANILLVKSITGPQDVELNLLMYFSGNGIYSGFTVSKIFIYVSQYEF